MRILVNALPFVGVLTGIQRYVRCLYREVEKLSEVSVGYFNGIRCHPSMPEQRDAQVWAKKTERLWRIPPSLFTELRILHWLALEQRLNMIAHSRRFDVYHETTSFAAAVKRLPVVHTVYDLSLLKHREKHPRERVMLFDFFFKRRLPYATHVLTISEFMRHEILQELKLPEDRVTAVPLAPEAVFYRRLPEQVAQVLAKAGWPSEYILFVGTLEPRKNLQLLIQALAQSKTKVPLILAGWQGWGGPDLGRELERLKLQDRVVCTGYVDEETLACLYSGAAAFVYPSWYEGFGLPVLEAMVCGCPVICSNTSSLPEVAGDAAILIDPRDAEGLAHALDTVLDDSALRRSLALRGLMKAAEFSWEHTALKTLEVFANMVESRAVRRES
jgi:glycosyltransferase involved in cell wall biosynthesis